MAAIEFVVRSSAGALSHGFVGNGSGAAASVVASAGADISLNLSRGQIVSYKQVGADLIVTLIDGQEITIDNFFGADNQPVADLYISSEGLLNQVQLAPGMGGTYYGNYVQQDVFGKWSPDDDLYFIAGNDPALTDPYVAPGDDAVGMLGLPIPLWGLGAVPLALLGLGGGGGDDGNDVLDDDDEREDPEGQILEGTKDVGHVVNAEDHADGVDISGTGTVGATVVVVINNHSHTTIINEQGTWTVQFSSTEINTGTYETEVVVTVSLDGRTITINDMLVVDTEVNVTFHEDRVGGNGLVNAVEQAGVVVLTGRVEASSSVSVVINGTTYAATVTGTHWSLSLPTGILPTGELTQSVTITATDRYENTTTITGSFEIDTVTSVTINSAIIGGNGTVNGSEMAAGTVITGTAQAGASVVVTVGSVSHTVTATASGTWSVTFAQGEILGGTYVAGVTAVATDQAGNTATATGNFNVDTETAVTFNAAIVGGNGHVNGAEAASTVVLTGTCEAGASVNVTLNGQSYAATVVGTTWTLNLAANTLVSGAYSQNVSVSATDAHGNTASTTGSFDVDTVTTVTFNAAATGGDGWVNAAENAGRVTLTGTCEAGARVQVTMNGSSYTATVTGTTWTLLLPTAVFASGEYPQAATVTATDAYGNTASTSGTFQVDTIVNRLTITNPIEGDDIINRAEAADGVTLTGTVEAGSTVQVTFNGVTRAATVSATGQWTVSFTAAELPSADADITITVAATDHVGNTRSLTETVALDLTPPEAPLIESYTRAGEGVRAFSVAMTDETFDIHSVAGNGTVTAVPHTVSNNPAFDEIDFNFTAPVPNGSHLVMTARDEAGNSSSTLFVLEESLTNTVNLANAGYDRFNLEAIDLQFAEDSVLTITASDLESLSAHSNALTIHGGIDDTVNIAGATATGQTQTIDGRTYDVYALGTNGGLLIIDEAITVNT